MVWTVIWAPNIINHFLWLGLGTVILLYIPTIFPS